MIPYSVIRNSIKKLSCLIFLSTLILLPLLASCRHGIILVPPKKHPYYAKQSARTTSNSTPDNAGKTQNAGTAVSEKYEIENAGNESMQIPAGNRWAVVVGISKYKNKNPEAGLPDLVFADDDAEDFYGALKKMGWRDSHIKLLLNDEATFMNIRIALESWLTKAGRNDLVLLYWSGHGYPDPDNPEKVYFACHDTDINIPATGYRMDAVRDTLEELNTKNVLLLADTCHAGKLITRGIARTTAIRPYMDHVSAEKSLPAGWIFMVSADTDRQAIENSSWSNGAFTHCLLEAMAGDADGYLSSGSKDGKITLGEIRTFLSSRMPAKTQQTLGVAKHPLITTSTGDPTIWEMVLNCDE